MKKYIELTNTHDDTTHLKIETYYNLGGYNPFTGKREKRGYYLGVTPVCRNTTAYGVTLESYAAFSGVRICIKKVSRKSEKAEKIADSMAATQEKALVSYVCDKNGLTLPECYNGEEAAV